MANAFESGALLGHVYTLDGAGPVRLRLAQRGDTAALKGLLAGEAGTADLDLARLVHFDPRRRYVVCATGLVSSTETLLGVGAIDLHGAAEPDILVTAEGQPEALAHLLRRVLVGAAGRRERNRAA